MKIKNLVLAISGAFLFASCAVTTPYIVTNNPIGKKTGISTTICLFSGAAQQAQSLAPYTSRVQYQGIMLNKEFGIIEAAKKGGISKIGAVDIKVTSYVFFTKKEFIVSGE